MHPSLRNLRTTELRTRERLNGAETEWVIGRLTAKRGVVDALRASSGESLLVEYDADVVNPMELLDFLAQCGVRAAPTVRA
jgi:hypothetical protein